ncbi:hypothetical protein D3C80_1919870 [compost metagenome]
MHRCCGSGQHAITRQDLTQGGNVAAQLIGAQARAVSHLRPRTIVGQHIAQRLMHLGILRVLRRQLGDISQRIALTHRQLPLIDHRIRRQAELVGNIAIQPVVTVGADG